MKVRSKGREERGKGRVSGEGGGKSGEGSREDKVNAKGKGQLTTFWLSMNALKGTSTASGSSGGTSVSDSDSQHGANVVGVDDNDLDDGANESVRAVRFAARHWPDARIDVVHAWFVPSLVAGQFSNPGADFDDLDAEAVAVIQRVLDAAAIDPSVDVRPRPVNGTPEFALMVASIGADLVVVAARGRGGFTGLLLGSTSLDPASHSHSPVAIVR